MCGTAEQDEKPFVSAKKVLMEMGEPYSSNVELVSFHTVSKGSLGECGIRGGYLEAVNLHPRTIDEIYKIASINLSPNIMGQVRWRRPPPGGRAPRGPRPWGPRSCVLMACQAAFHSGRCTLCNTRNLSNTL